MGTYEDDWAASGLAALTGFSHGVADLSRAPVLARAQQRLSQFVDATSESSRFRWTTPGSPEASIILAGRAALLGLSRHGRESANGTSRLLRAADGWWALTLSRPDDVDTVPALVGSDIPRLTDSVSAAWSAVREFSATRAAQEMVDMARLLDLPAGVLGETEPSRPGSSPRGPSRSEEEPRELLVADLSSLWAGPLCSRLLADGGATVVKVESPTRPDGARLGNADFFRWLNHGKLSYAVDLHRERDRIARLLRAADVVIEASRPRALRRLELGPEHVEPRPGQVWVRITGHGIGAGNEDWVGFGDDAAVSGGLVGRTDDGPVFCGDALADPLTGIEAALAVVQATNRGDGVLLDVSLAGTAAVYAEERLQGTASSVPIARPQSPFLRGKSAAELGADNHVVDEVVERRLSSGVSPRR